MNYDIRRLSDNFPRVHSRYYVDTNGVVYTSIAKDTNKITVEGRVQTFSFNFMVS